MINKRYETRRTLGKVPGHYFQIVVKDFDYSNSHLPFPTDEISTILHKKINSWNIVKDILPALEEELYLYDEHEYEEDFLFLYPYIKNSINYKEKQYGFLIYNLDIKTKNSCQYKPFFATFYLYIYDYRNDNKIEYFIQGKRVNVRSIHRYYIIDKVFKIVDKYGKRLKLTPKTQEFKEAAINISKI
jgi:hypothetical protein